MNLYQNDNSLKKDLFYFAGEEIGSYLKISFKKQVLIITYVNDSYMILSLHSASDFSSSTVPFWLI